MSESTLVWEHDLKRVELYTTSRRVALKAISRNGNFLEFKDLQPGFAITYHLDELKSPADCIRLGDPVLAEQKLKSIMTLAECQARHDARQRMLKLRHHES